MYAFRKTRETGSTVNYTYRFPWKGFSRTQVVLLPTITTTMRNWPRSFISIYISLTPEVALRYAGFAGLLSGVPKLRNGQYLRTCSHHRDFIWVKIPRLTVQPVTYQCLSNWSSSKLPKTKQERWHFGEEAAPDFEQCTNNRQQASWRRQ